MATLSNQARLIVRDENLEVRQKKIAFDGKTKNPKGAGKKGLTARRPLGDLTNKRNIHVEVTAKKPTVPKIEFNIAEECFLHDHNKCMEAKNAALEYSVLDLILPKCDMVFINSQDSLRSKEKDLDNFLVPDEMEIADLSQWDSPPPSYTRSYSPPSPFNWKFEPVEFVLKDE